MSKQPPEVFYLPESYRIRYKNEHWNDVGQKEEWQLPTYLQASHVASVTGAKSVIDVGCGSAFKLLKYLGDLETTGVEVGPALDHLRKAYPEGRRWEHGDWQADFGRFDLLICSDVVEHLPDPRVLLSFIERHEPYAVVISTPVRGRKSGPPINRCHCMEWEPDEFYSFLTNGLKEYGFVFSIESGEENAAEGSLKSMVFTGIRGLPISRENATISEIIKR